MRISKATGVAGVLTAIVLGTAGAAFAGHAHFVIREDRSGTTYCQYVASGQTSISDPSHGGYHRFHENVHVGKPGSDTHGNDFDKASNEAARCDIVYWPGSRRP